ncbi:polymorphic toxin-type HINT domain-containing protein [Fangia hongkongensis]|uniref:polymorphic toxin-type HINT domain-containing protein n=1 Tax=Fangia hongkongensis TaxID=270495 RepID=UPI00037C0D25|nr:polymorphic toxin-type HINT domain-containing protein [Fangia hongkongensis]MBK2124339.1 hypothetical protein [Fangia hongkongensis]
MKLTFNRVTATYTYNRSKIYQMLIDDEKFHCTGNHPFYTYHHKQFIPAGQLHEGEKLIQLEAKLATLQKSTQIQQNTQVHDITVNDTHTFLWENKALGYIILVVGMGMNLKIQ